MRTDNNNTGIGGMVALRANRRVRGRLVGILADGTYLVSWRVSTPTMRGTMAMSARDVVTY